MQKIHLGPAKCALDLGDGSERAEYVNQDYILHKLGRPHRAIPAGTTIRSPKAFLAAAPGSIMAIEGPNEPDLNPVTYGGVTDAQWQQVLDVRPPLGRHDGVEPDRRAVPGRRRPASPRRATGRRPPR